MEGRISYYHHPQLLIELANLRRIDIISGGKVKWKVDHPQKMQDLAGNPVKGAKDLADALSGMVRHCMMQEPDSDPVPMSPVEVLTKISAVAKKPFTSLGSNWAIGSDYRP
jgi:hypothetical protein